MTRQSRMRRAEPAASATRAEAKAVRAKPRRDLRDRAANAMKGVFVTYDPGTNELLRLPTRAKRALPGIWRIEPRRNDGSNAWRVYLWRDGVWFGIGCGRELANAVSAARKSARQFMFDRGVRGAP